MSCFRFLNVNFAVCPLSQTLNEPNPELVKLLHKIANKEDIGTHDLFYIVKSGKDKGKKRPIIESFNLNKLKSQPEILNTLQAKCKVLDLKQLKRASVNEG